MLREGLRVKRKELRLKTVEADGIASLTAWQE